MARFPEPFPPLLGSGRDREFNEYPDEAIRSSVVYLWLVEAWSNREIDDEILHINERYPGVENRGWKSHGILGYLGLSGRHKGYFRGMDSFQILSAMQKLCVDDRHVLIDHYLLEYITNAYSLADPEKARRDRERQSQDWIRHVLLNDAPASQYNDILRQVDGSSNHCVVVANTRRYYSSPTLKESVKDLYDFRCEVCGDVILHHGWRSGLPRREEWDFLSADVHHILPLSKKGPDRSENMLCLCPSCHRKFHSGEFRLKMHGSSLVCRDELLGVDRSLRQLHVIHLF